MQLAAAVGEHGEVTAIDLYENKLRHIEDEQKRLRVRTAIDVHAIDLSIGTGGLAPQFDRVLIDAPCTGLGTLHRRPEILLRVRAEDVPRMMELQVAIVSNAAKLVRPGGLLVYAVCSPMREEGSGVVQRIEARAPQLERTHEPWTVRVEPDEDDLLRLGPWSEPFSEGSSHDTWGIDVYQVFRWRARSPI